VAAMVLAVPPVTHPPQENPMIRVATTPRAVPCSRRVRDSPCRIDGTSMAFAFPCEEARHKPRRRMFISSNPKDSLSKIAHFRLSMVSVPDVGLIHLTRNDRLPTAFVPGAARRPRIGFIGDASGARQIPQQRLDRASFRHSRQGDRLSNMKPVASITLYFSQSLVLVALWLICELLVE
jgi:hypothetical protein